MANGPHSNDLRAAKRRALVVRRRLPAVARPRTRVVRLSPWSLDETRCRLASEAPKMKATLGLTGLTVNAMALIAPGAFLWLTYQIQSAYGAPMSGSDIWFGIVAALLLCF